MMKLAHIFSMPIVIAFFTTTTFAQDPAVVETHPSKVPVSIWPGPGSSAANSPSDVAIAYDPFEKKILAFGGRDTGSNSTLGGAIVSDVELVTTPGASANNQLKFQQLLTSTTPTPRYAARMTFSTWDRHIYMFGGLAGGSHSNQLWKIDLSSTTPDWTQVVPTSGPTPAGRFEHMFSYFEDPDTGAPYLLLIGGEIAPSQLSNDMWVFDILSSVWIQIQNPGLPNLSRAGLAWHPSYGFVLAGGTSNVQNGQNIPMNAITWEWDGFMGGLQNPVWTQKTITNPLPIQNVAMAYDARSDKIISVGGSRQTGGYPSTAGHLEVFEYHRQAVGGQTGWIDRWSLPTIDPRRFHFVNSQMTTTPAAGRERLSLVRVDKRRSLVGIGGGFRDILEIHPAPSTMVSVAGQILYPGGCTWGGAGPFNMTFENLPTRGQVATLRVTLSNVSSGQLGGILYGPLYPGPGYANIPLNVSPTNPPAECRLYPDLNSPATVQGVAFLTPPTAIGQTYKIHVPVPDNVGIVGFDFHFQAWFVDPQFQPYFPTSTQTTTYIRTTSVPNLRMGY